MSLYADEAEDRGVMLRSGVPDDVTVVGDETRLRQVLANLIENAVKYTDRGGRVDIEAHTRDAEVELTVRRADKRVRIDVRLSGTAGPAATFVSTRATMVGR